MAQSLYWWLKSVLPHILDTVFQHIKAGSSTFDPASQLNHIADTATTTAHYQPSYFSLWSPNKGFIEFISLISSPLTFLINSHVIYSSIAVSKRTHFISSHFSDQLF